MSLTAAGGKSAEDILRKSVERRELEDDKGNAKLLRPTMIVELLENIWRPQCLQTCCGVGHSPDNGGDVVPKAVGLYGGVKRDIGFDRSGDPNNLKRSSIEC